jgi:protein ImuB
MFACLFQPRPADDSRVALAALAYEFSPRYELSRVDLVTIDVSGLDRLLGPPAAIGAELVREAAARELRVHVAIAATHTAARVLALSRPGVTVVDRGKEAAALALVPIGVLEQLGDHVEPQNPQKPVDPKNSASSAISAVKHWGVRTLGELAALPSADLVARLGRPARAWQAIARGEDIKPLVPALPEERFEGTLELEWPIDGLEPLSFVLTRLLEPLSTRLERRDRGAAVLHVVLRLATATGREGHARRLELPTPLRDVRTLRTLALLDLESHPPDAPIECVTVVIDPTPGRVVQHTLFTRAQPTPERLSTLLARLGALLGQDRIGAPALVDSYRPGAFAMQSFSTDHGQGSRQRAGGASVSLDEAGSARSALKVVSMIRRCRQPVPARVATEHDRPLRVTTDRRGFAGGSVIHAAGPWRTSGNWWAGRAEQKHPVLDTREHYGASASGPGVGPRASEYWHRDEWDVSLSDGGVYRIFRDRETGGWFIDAVFD